MTFPQQGFPQPAQQQGQPQQPQAPQGQPMQPVAQPYYQAPPPQLTGWQPPQPQQQPAQGQPVQQQQGQPMAPLAPQGVPGYSQAPASVMQQRFTQQDGVPPELVGKTMAEAMQIYNAMRQTVIRTMPRGQPQPQQQPQQGYQQQQPQQPQGAPNPVANPQAFMESLEQRLTQIIDQRLAPVTQSNVEQRAYAARDNAARAFQDFAQLEPQILQELSVVSAEALGNPQVWQQAYYLVKGRLAAQGGQPQGQPQQQQAPWQQQQAPAVNAPQQMWAPAQPFAQSFVEGANAQPQFAGGVQLTPEQRMAAQKFGIPEAQYAAAVQGMYIANGGQP